MYLPCIHIIPKKRIYGTTDYVSQLFHLKVEYLVVKLIPTIPADSHVSKIELELKKLNYFSRYYFFYNFNEIFVMILIKLLCRKKKGEKMKNRRIIRFLLFRHCQIKIKIIFCYRQWRQYCD